jgi:hypothetical protein
MFAFEQVTAPQWDLLCLGKGLSGGALAISVTLVRRHVFDAFLAAPQRARACHELLPLEPAERESVETGAKLFESLVKQEPR